MFKRVFSMTALAAMLAAGPADAGSVGVEVAFSDREAKIIRAWYESQAGDHGGPASKGKARKSLPPGVAKNLARGKPLPPGIAKQVLPSGLVAQLPPPPRGFERIEVAGRILLVEIATQVIHDVLEDLILR